MERKQLNKKPDTQSGVGRPTDYRAEYCNQVIEWGKLGYSKTQMCSKFGISRNCLYEWAKVHIEFNDALSVAMAHSEAWWEQEALTGIRQPTKDFNAGLFGKVMSARFPETWRDTTNTLHGGLGGGPIPVAISTIPNTPEGLRDFYKQFVDKATCPIVRNADSV